jgi:hypothetical protein
MDTRVRPVLSAIAFISMVLAISISWRSAAKVRLNLGFLTALKVSSPSARAQQAAGKLRPVANRLACGVF